MKYLITLTLALIIFSVFAIANPASSFAVDFPITICHHNPGNEVTLTFQNQQSYEGHLGTPHSGSTYDTPGPCETADVPEFGLIPGVLAALTSGGTFLYMKKRFIK